MVLHVHFTAFGPFGGVPINPTALLIKRLPSFIAEHIDSLPAHVVIDDLTEMETSAHGAQQTLTLLHSNTTDTPPPQPPPSPTPSSSSRPSSPSSPLPPSSSSPSPTRTRHLWLHLGVHPRSSHLLLESSAYNEMDFRIPDQRLYQPRHLPILAAAPARHSTRIDLPLLHQLLSPQHPCRLSSDAGRFLCNFAYFTSLQRCVEKRGRRRKGGEEAGECAAVVCEDAMFVHVPPFERVHEEAQLHFLLDLLLCLGRLEEEGVQWVREEEEEEVGQQGELLMGAGDVSDQIDIALCPHVQQALRGVREGKASLGHERPPSG